MLHQTRRGCGRLGLRGAVAIAMAASAPNCAVAAERAWVHPPECVPDDGGIATTLPSATGNSLVDYFTGDGRYMPRTHCLVNEAGAPDWPWIIALLALTTGVVVWYARIFVFWMQCYFQEEKRDRNPKLFDLAAIFLFCAICGYVASIVMFFWPGYRLLAGFLLGLNFFSFRFCLSLDRFRQVFAAGRLDRELREEVESRAVTLQAALEEKTLELSVSERRLRTLVQNLPGVAFRMALDERGTNVVVSDGIEAITGYPASDFVGESTKSCDSIIHRDDLGKVNAAIRSAVDQRSSYEVEYRITHRDGGTRWVLERGQVVTDEATGEPLFVDGLQFDVTGMKRLEDTLRRDSMIDRLTGLPNRHYLLQRLDRMWAARKERTGVVLFLDFDRFKIINDTLGHEAGDDLLRQFASRLRSAIGSGDDNLDHDRPIVCRLGGDEFVAVLPSVATDQEPMHIAKRLQDACREPFRVGAQEVSTAVSVGVAIMDRDASSPDDPLRNADIAMYEAKLAGRGQIVRFDAGMRRKRRERLLLEQELRHAIARDELSIVFQPIMSLESGRCASVETLLRWTNPRCGEVSPSVFIPIAEESDLIVEIGEWVARRAIEAFAGWRVRLGDAAPSSISVNLSRRQLTCPSTPSVLRGLLRDHRLEPDALCVEITENQVVGSLPEQLEALRTIRAHGVRVAMDDFGTGLSSLSGLHQFPIDVLKIDRSFVHNLDEGKQFMVLARSIIDLASNLGLKTVAEGIETPEHLAALQALGCQYGQGFYFARPMSESAIERFLDEHRGGAAHAA